MSELVLDEAARARLKKFHNDGLVFLVNTALLHPRGLALAIHLDDDGEPLGLSIFGEGDEPWVFGRNAQEAIESIGAQTLERYFDAEGRREAVWSLPLGASS